MAHSLKYFLMQGLVHGSFGFARCASHLLILEKNWIQLDEGRRQAELQATRAAFDAGLQALLARFPYLA